MLSLNDKESLRYSQKHDRRAGKISQRRLKKPHRFCSCQYFPFTNEFWHKKINTNKNKRKNLFDHYGNKCHCLTRAKLLIPRIIAVTSQLDSASYRNSYSILRYRSPTSLSSIAHYFIYDEIFPIQSNWKYIYYSFTFVSMI